MSEIGELTPKQIAKIWEETEKKLAEEGLAPIKLIAQDIKQEIKKDKKLGLKNTINLEIVSGDALSDTEHEITGGLDSEVEFENKHPSEESLGATGDSPCKRIIRQMARAGGVQNKDPTLIKREF